MNPNTTPTNPTMDAEESSARIGQGLSEEDIADISQFIEDAAPNVRYRANPDIDVIYEILEKEGWEDKVSALADRWVAVRQ